jgi:hypothetical protein
MPAYDATLFQPPAPLAFVTLRKRDAELVVSDVPMLLDTGSDITLVPRTAIYALDSTLVSDNSYELVGFDGHTSFAPVVQVELVFCRRTFRGQFLLIDQSYGILGRNVLNAVPLFLDGPRLQWDEQR